MSHDHESESLRTDAVRLYFGLAYLLFAGVPLIVVSLIGVSYAWDVERGGDCGALQGVLGFLKTNTRWYFALAGSVIIAFPKLVSLLNLRTGEKGKTRASPPADNVPIGTRFSSRRRRWWRSRLCAESVGCTQRGLNGNFHVQSRWGQRVLSQFAEL